MIKQDELAQLVRDYIAFSQSDSDKERGREVLVLIEGSPEFWRRPHFYPGHVTASVFVVNKHQNATLLVNHRKLGRWQQLGGHIEEEDHTIFDAAARELAEESGLMDARFEKSIFDIDIHAIPWHGTERGHCHFDIRILARVVGDETVRSQEDEPQDVRWILFDDIEGYTKEESVLRMVRKFQMDL